MSIRPNPELQIRNRFWLCLECGLLWSPSVDLKEAKHQIRTFGTEELKAATLTARERGLPLPAGERAATLEKLPVPAAVPENGVSAAGCPYCGKALRTPWARQCRHCRRDWHDPERLRSLGGEAGEV